MTEAATEVARTTLRALAMDEARRIAWSWKAHNAVSSEDLASLYVWVRAQASVQMIRMKLELSEEEATDLLTASNRPSR